MHFCEDCGVLFLRNTTVVSMAGMSWEADSYHELRMHGPYRALGANVRDLEFTLRVAGDF